METFPINGQIKCFTHEGKTELSTLEFKYPLRLMEPKSYIQSHKVVYILSYGGGLLEGDCVRINVEVGPGSALSLLNTASTKVFKRNENSCGFSAQILQCNVGADSLLAVLPEPITCFKNGAYKQKQFFQLDKDASLFLLDWNTSGRYIVGERWEFHQYFSDTKITVDERVILRDTWNLEQDPVINVVDRLGDYNCIANIILIGKRMELAIQLVNELYSKIVINRKNTYNSGELLWSLSELDLLKGNGVIIRAAAVETGMIRNFILEILQPLESQIGDYFSKA